ncbi:hypothetical protein [Sodalinema gerasimenkoae]|uniref:hypothetical protein n=1 Tax=Sodalinema gerasimenkoae TaxID=2862348 RepID=UPI00135C0340|nr:hypothetical protein [Sodalinema gerasimenkoae]
MSSHHKEHQLAIALLSLRLSVFLVMFVWTLDKFINPDHAARIFENFYKIGGLGNEAFYLIGAVQLLIVLGFVAGFKKRWTYGLVLFLHSVSTFSSFRQYLDPFNNLLFFAAFPMLAACFTLYYLRKHDTLWAIDSP